MIRLASDIDLTNDQWQILEPLIPKATSEEDLVVLIYGRYSMPSSTYYPVVSILPALHPEGSLPRGWGSDRPNLPGGGNYSAGFLRGECT